MSREDLMKYLLVLVLGGAVGGAGTGAMKSPEPSECNVPEPRIERLEARMANVENILTELAADVAVLRDRSDHPRAGEGS